MNNTFLVHRHVCCFIRKLNGEKAQAFSCSQDQISKRPDRQAPEEQKKRADGWGLRTSHPAPISNPVCRRAPLTVPPSRTSNESFSFPICASSWNLEISKSSFFLRCVVKLPNSIIMFSWQNCFFF